MNGMKANKSRLAYDKRYTQEGLPRDANEWTVQDWCDLWRSIKRATAKIRKRHKR